MLTSQVDEDVNQILKAMVKGEADGKLQAMTTIIVSMGAEGFGEEEGKSMRTFYSKNHRVVRIHNIRQENRALKSQYNKAGESELIGSAQLMFFFCERRSGSSAEQSGIRGAVVKGPKDVLLLWPTPLSSPRSCWGRSAVESWYVHRKK